MKYRVFAILAGSALLAACTNGAPITSPPVQVTVKNSSINNSRILGYTEPVVRTFLSQGDGTEVIQEVSHNQKQKSPSESEITGVACEIDSAEISAKFVTPAIVRVPKFKGRPTTIRMKCATETLEATYKFEPTLDGVIVAGPSVAGLIAAAVSAGVAASQNSWSYGANDISAWIPLTEKE